MFAVMCGKDEWTFCMPLCVGRMSGPFVCLMCGKDKRNKFMMVNLLGGGRGIYTATFICAAGLLP